MLLQLQAAALHTFPTPRTPDLSGRDRAGKRQRMPHVLTAAWLALIAAERLSQCAAWTQHKESFC